MCWSKATECHLIMYEGFLKPCIRRSALFKSVIPEKKVQLGYFKRNRSDDKKKKTNKITVLMTRLMTN